jgi:hypothetical protein
LGDPEGETGQFLRGAESAAHAEILSEFSDLKKAT